MTVKTEKSQVLFTEAQQFLPGGVDSPVRAFRAVRGQPLFIHRGVGSKIYDVDGNEFIDYVCSWGPLILGHAYPRVVAALQRALELGTSFGAPTPLETELAKLVHAAMPSVELVRFVSSGTEATMSALRVARAYTGRDKIIKFEGCYHGHADALLAKAGSGVLTLGLPGTPGVPAAHVADTLVVPYNHLDTVERLFAAHPDQIAAVIVEPVAGNMGVVSPQAGFLEGLRRLTREHNALLIFDEVITGFRVAYGGAQALYRITPDLTCLGKIIGGGLPVGAYGGRRDIMEWVAPLGPVYQAGTLSGNPLAMTAGIETLRALQEPNFYQRLEAKASALAQGLTQAARKAGVPAYVSRVGSLLTLFFTEKEVVDNQTASSVDTALYAGFFHAMLEKGVYLPPSQFEALFVSAAHTEADIAATVQAAQRSLQMLGRTASSPPTKGE